MVSFSMWGVRWQVTFGFCTALAVFLLLDPGGFSLEFLLAAVIHELGHLLAISLLHAPVKLVSLTATGMRLRRGGRLGIAGELAILLAGPGANILAAVLLYMSCGGQEPVNTALRLSASSLALGLYHLLPVAGLDGGSVLELLCMGLLGYPRGAACSLRIAIAVSVALELGLAAASFLYGASFGIAMLALVLALGMLSACLELGRS